MTMEQFRARCRAAGVSPSKVAQYMGYTRQWLYIERKEPLRRVVELALPAAISHIKEQA